MPAATTSRLRRLAAAATVAARVAGWGGGLAAALSMTAPRTRAVAKSERLAGLRVADVATTAADGVPLAGWLVRAPGDPGRCVVLAAGIGGTRRAMASRAAWYAQRGWSALLVDLRGTGESAPERVAMGWHEAKDLAAWTGFARAQGFTASGVHGQSLGAAAGCYAALLPEPPAWSFAVLEACYRDIDAAMVARMPGIPRPLLWPLVVCAEWLLGVDAARLDPVAAIRQMRAPTLLACGVHDHLVGPDAHDLLFAACAADRKERVDVPDVGHVDLFHAPGSELPARLAAFLAQLP
ncbi:MAG: alpha/beta hydrolase [Planctomycetota bacterium]